MGSAEQGSGRDLHIRQRPPMAPPIPVPDGRMHPKAPFIGRSRAVRVFAVLLFLPALAPRLHAQTVGSDYTTPPSIEYGSLFQAVQLASVFPDGKTFPELVPSAKPVDILAAYNAAKASPGFDLTGFTNQYFSGPAPAGPTVSPGAGGQHLLSYIASLWPALEQSTTTVPPYSTLLPLPYSYIVPGGRFGEVYYWDSYFTMLGLEVDGRNDIAVNMLKNFAYEIDKYGHIPNGNRSYYLSRSQPPFFSLMVELIARSNGAATYTTYLPQLQAEYDYWMQGENEALPGQAVRHVVRLLDGTVLNRYWDERAAPRDESYKEDVQTASGAYRPQGEVWRNLRAAAESGWDFSSRWLADGKTLSTIRTLDILPPDLNSLLLNLETTLSEAYLLKGDQKFAGLYARRARVRAQAIRRLMWDAENHVFTDYLWREGETTRTVTAATLYPLFLGVATPNQAQAVAETVRDKLLQTSGLATTLVTSGQQWDSPNGWAPLQWIAVAGLRNYRVPLLAEEIADRWVAKNIAGYQQQAKLVEKYNVTTQGGDTGSGGGEYTTQIGFGWTNGVLLALTSLYPNLKAAAEAATPNTQLAPAQ